MRSSVINYWPFECCNSGVAISFLLMLLVSVQSSPIYDNMPCPMIYTATIHSCKNDNFQMINSDIFIIFAPNIDCGHVRNASVRPF